MNLKTRPRKRRILQNEAQITLVLCSHQRLGHWQLSNLHILSTSKWQTPDIRPLNYIRIVWKAKAPHQTGWTLSACLKHIFTMHQILKNTHEKQNDNHRIFIGFKAASLCKLTLSNSESSVRIGKHLSKSFDIDQDLKQGDFLSYDFFIYCWRK